MACRGASICCSATCRATSCAAGPRGTASPCSASPANKSNGLAWDRAGPTDRPASMPRAASRAPSLTARITVLASHHDGKELNSPNDIVVKRDGAIYFTDPTYGRDEYYGVPRQPRARLPRRLPGRAGRQVADPAGRRFRPAERAVLLARRAGPVRQRHRPPAHPRLRRAAGRHARPTAASGQKRSARVPARRTA